MKEFAIGADPVDFGWAKRLTLRQRWMAIGGIWSFYFATSLIWESINLTGLLLSVIYSLLLIKTNSAESKINNYFEQKLVFGSDNLVFKSSDTIHWHIPFHRLDRIEQAISGPRWAPISTALIYTNDNDSYLISGELSPETVEKIHQEIERIKLSTQGRTNE